MRTRTGAVPRKCRYDAISLPDAVPQAEMPYQRREADDSDMAGPRCLAGLCYRLRDETGSCERNNRAVPLCPTFLLANCYIDVPRSD
jgi:hypothetical protein